VRGNLVHCLDRDGKNRTLTYAAFPSAPGKKKQQRLARF